MTTIQVEINFPDPKIADLYKAVALLSGIPLGDVIADVLDRYANTYADGDELVEIWAERFNGPRKASELEAAIPQ